MNIYKLLKISEKLKPILLRIFPKKFLNEKREKIFNNAIYKLSQYQPIAYEPHQFPYGINLIAGIRANTGLGESSRIVARHLAAAKIPFTIIEWYSSNNQIRDNEEFIEKISNEFKYSINLIHINAHEFGIALKQIGLKCLDYRYNIAFWSWELEEFPKEWHGSFKVLDEIWTPSYFTSKSIKKVTNKPVYTIPHTISKPSKLPFAREHFSLPNDKFLFLILYNSGSLEERKNPIAGIKAYKKVFLNSNNTGLVIKVGDCTVNERNKLIEETKDIKNIYYIFDSLMKCEVNSLISCIDVYVSLHRAEGFGLVLAEAMSFGKPVIATNWSANIEFMDEDSACMVEYELVPVNTEIGGFKKSYRWAEADIEQASFFMKKLYSDKGYYNYISKNAKKKIEQQLNEEHIKSLIYEHYINIKNGDVKEH